jgi:hypothetical protein
LNDDTDLEFRLRRSIELAKEQKAMANKKKVTTKERASVGRELKLALALRALMDSLTDAKIDDPSEGGVTMAEQDAAAVLNDLGYSTLEGIPRRIARLNEQLKAAVEAGDGATIAALGLELVRAKEGKPPSKSAAVSAAKKSSRNGAAKVSTQSTATASDAASAASGD